MATTTLFSGVFGNVPGGAGGGSGCTATRKCQIAIPIAVTGAGPFATGTCKNVVQMPYDFTLTCVVNSVTTHPCGQCAVFDIQLNGTSIYCLQPSIPNGCTSDKCTSYCLAATCFTKYDVLTFEVCQVGNCYSGADWKAWVIGTER